MSKRREIPEITPAEALMTPPGKPVDLSTFPSALEVEPRRLSDTEKGHLAVRAANMENGGFPAGDIDAVTGEAPARFAETPGVTPNQIQHAEKAKRVTQGRVVRDEQGTLPRKGLPPRKLVTADEPSAIEIERRAKRRSNK